MSKLKEKEIVATGRRKTAVASVRMRDGKGAIIVNDRPFETYFPLELQRKTILSAFEKIGGNRGHDLLVRLKGGGLEGQATALSLAIARALVAEDETTRPALKAAGLLTRDPRKKERKKYGLAGARKRFQFSKR
ncbi:MAG: 30S ribosomal protein S9 [Parachlamydiaceae bacterium]